MARKIFAYYIGILILMLSLVIGLFTTLFPIFFLLSNFGGIILFTIFAFTGFIIAWIINKKGFISSLVFGVILAVILSVGSVDIWQIFSNGILIIVATSFGGFIGEKLAAARSSKRKVAEKGENYLFMGVFITSVLVNIVILPIILTFIFTPYWDYLVIIRVLPRFCKFIQREDIRRSNIKFEQYLKVFCEFPLPSSSTLEKLK